jgi:hypothetical protein
MTRTLYYAVGAVCACLAIVIAAEFDWTVAPVAASPAEPPSPSPPATDDAAAPPDLDAMIGDILERPLFTASRHPPPGPVAEERESGPAPRTAPVLTGRLGGTMIGPDDEREAIFAREGEKPLAVRVGDEIDGYTVHAIEADRVVLTSDFGERTVEPSFGGAGEGASAVRPAARRNPAIVPPGPGAPPGLIPGMQRGIPNPLQPFRPPGVANQAQQPNVFNPAVARRNQRP